MSTFKVDTESRNKLNMQMIHRKGHHRDKRPSMVSEMGSRAQRGSYGNLPHNYNSRTTSFGSNRAISLDHYNHRRMSDGIQTVTSDSTVYYHQRVNEQDVLLRAAGEKRSSSCQGSTEVKLVVSEDPMGKNEASAVTDENEEPNRVHSNNNSSLTSKSLKSKLASSVTCSPNSPKSILTRLRQLTGRLSFSFDKESRRTSSGTQTIIKTSPASAKNNATPNVCCTAKSSACGNSKSGDATARNRAYSLDVPVAKYFNNSSDASSNKNDDADDSTDNSAFASKKLSAEVEAADI